MTLFLPFPNIKISLSTPFISRKGSSFPSHISRVLWKFSFIPYSIYIKTNMILLFKSLDMDNNDNETSSIKVHKGTRFCCHEKCCKVITMTCNIVIFYSCVKCLKICIRVVTPEMFSLIN